MLALITLSLAAVTLGTILGRLAFGEVTPASAEDTTRVLSTQAQQSASLQSAPPPSAISAEYRALSMQFVNSYARSLDTVELSRLTVRIGELRSLLSANSTFFGK